MNFFRATTLSKISTDRRICKSSVTKMTALVFTHFILSKMFLRELIVFDLFLRIGSSSSTLVFFFFLPNFFEKTFVPICLAYFLLELRL